MAPEAAAATASASVQAKLSPAALQATRAAAARQRQLQQGWHRPAEGQTGGLVEQQGEG